MPILKLSNAATEWFKGFDRLIAGSGTSGLPQT